MGRRLKYRSSEKSRQRKQGNKSPHSIILIVCEGKETEYNYFTDLKERLKLGAAITVEVDKSKAGHDPKSLVEHAVERMKGSKESNYHGKIDEVWVVFDVEAERHANARRILEAKNQAKNQVKGKGIKLAISNPAFELWFLLHYQAGGTPYENCKKVITALKKEHVSEYKKSCKDDDDFYGKLFAKLDDAIKNAKTLIKTRWQDETPGNPSTAVYQLVERLKKESEK